MRRISAVVCGAALIAAPSISVFGTASAGASNVNPATFSASLDPGGSTTVTKVVTTPAIAPKPDIYFLSDTSGSMAAGIANVQANASSILSTISSSTTDPMFGVGDYKDFPFDTYAFANDAPIGTSADALTAINNWSASGGFDGPEAQLFALHEIATNPAIGFRSDSTRIVVWFGDSPGHDPVCSAISGLGSDLTTAGVAAELAAAHVEVIAISVPTGAYPAMLDDDASVGATDYNALCGAPSPVTNEAATIAAATGGLDLVAADPSDVANQILAGLTNLPVSVTGSPTCDPGLTVSLAPSTQSVTSGDTATFDETISVASDATQGSTLTCAVKFLLNGQDAGADFTQSVSITVNDITPPTAACVPTTNPSGKNIPKAGDGTGKSGENPDGFYQMVFSDNVGIASAVIQDSAGSFSVPVTNGEKDKLVQAGGTPHAKPGPRVITQMIFTNGDPQLVVTDTSGNVTTVDCLVPAPPK